MSGTALWPWVVLLCLGACHGLNPGLGWLFAVALSLQERRRATVYRALGPIALGHALSITAVLVVVGGIQVVVSESIVPYVSAAVLGAFGLYRLIRSWHPRWYACGVQRPCLIVLSHSFSAWGRAHARAHPLALARPGVWPRPLQLTVCPSHDSARMLSYQELPTSLQWWRGYGEEAKRGEAGGPHITRHVKRLGRFSSRMRPRDVSAHGGGPERCHASGAAMDLGRDAPAWTQRAERAADGDVVDVARSLGRHEHRACMRGARFVAENTCNCLPPKT